MGNFTAFYQFKHQRIVALVPALDDPDQPGIVPGLWQWWPVGETVHAFLIAMVDYPRAESGNLLLPMGTWTNCKIFRTCRVSKIGLVRIGLFFRPFWWGFWWVWYEKE